ncbi:M28 family peptidase [Sabulicella glaciei]|uniref:M28 family metallopeptidase n=1 Tax=Sabulicella glaciei TaxID=2984948 RepID=A0ABT3NVU0_9PROT|nr:M28 family peptidase [Roseococcus sp. MDT2-1-1]MCW8086280.1 M28 family metallopeptidase [Roseococcus sp. MDT2-1-1]
MSRDAFLARLGADPDLRADWDAICGIGGRLQGSESCERAFDLVAERLGQLGPVEVARTRYMGWTPGEARIEAGGEAIPCLPLNGAAGTGGEWRDWEILDLSRGLPEDFRRAGDAPRGRAVLLRHEFPFGTDTVHRRVKLRVAEEAGAAAAIMVQPLPGIGPVTGGANDCPLPGFGVGVEGARAMLAAGRARFLQSGTHGIATARHLILDLPGRGPGRVVLSAHLDGHAPGESAMDNASGVAALLALGRAARPFLSAFEHGLTLCIFGAEEWSLSGSRAWLAGLARDRVAAMGANLNLDTVVGSARLTALTSGFPALSQAVRQVAGPEMGIHETLMVNSDHANFAALGIPSLRLIAGFNEPDSPVARLLTAGDRRDAVPQGQLEAAAKVAGAILWALLERDAAAMAALREGAADARAAVRILSPLPPQE